MPRQTVISRKRRGPPPTGKGVPILVRIRPELLASLDAWIRKEGVSLSRPEAIRRLIELALSTKSERPTGANRLMGNSGGEGSR